MSTNLMSPNRFVGASIAALLVLSLVAGVAAGAPVAASETNCETEVVHDAYKTDQEAINALANGTDVESYESNTRVLVGENNTFYQIKGENPNTYCVHFVVKISSEAIPPAQLPAEIPSNNGEHKASWDAVHNFTSGETHTQIEFTLPADSEAAWSPHEVRIASISWASETRGEATGLFDRVRDRFGNSDDELAKRKYDIVGNATGEQVTIPLENPQTGEDIDEWQARYTTNGGSTWHALENDADDPVFYREVKDGSAVRLTFNDPDTRVKFVANPTRKDKITEDYTMWKSGLREIKDKLPWSG